jgi:hypothetical protein
MAAKALEVGPAKRYFVSFTAVGGGAFSKGCEALGLEYLVEI